MASGKADFQTVQKIINEDIKTASFRKVYLLTGEQAYLRNQNRDKLVEAILGPAEDPESSFNYSCFRGDQVTAGDIKEMAQTLPFFAGRRVIVLEDSGFFDKNQNEAQLLTEFIPDIPDTTTLIVSQAKIDKRQKLYKALEKEGLVLDTDSVDPELLGRWAKSLFTKASLTISGRDLALFMDRAGTDMLRIQAEAEKLISYKMADGVSVPGTVTAQDILTIGSAEIKDRVFELTDALAAKDRNRAFGIYLELQAGQTPPQVMLSLMQRQFLILLQVKEMAGRIPDAEIARTLKIPSFAVSKRYKPAAAACRMEELVRMLDKCADIDAEYKSGKIDAGAALEMLMVSASQS